MHIQSTSMIAISPFEHPEFDEHENIVFAHDRKTGLSAIIAVHNTNRGPGLGGCRIWPYTTSMDALTDALRLSRGMTYKNALAGLDLGGGKAVIIADPRQDKTAEMMRAFGEHVDRLNGAYITAEDVGVSPIDMEEVAQKTVHVRGTKTTGLGDPSPYTALGVFCGIKASAEKAFGSSDLSGRTVSVQGLGHVGFALCQQLHDAGAKLIVSDIHAPSVAKAKEAFGAEHIAAEQAHAARADIYAPCALGGTLNAKTIPQITAKVIAGAANNQLKKAEDGFELHKRGILYAPDYAINAGGVISIALAKPDENDEKVRQKTLAIADTLNEIFDRAERENKTPEQIADRIAEERFCRRRDRTGSD